MSDRSNRREKNVAIQAIDKKESIFYRMLKMAQKSVIIIGAGLGGLVAGNLLVKKGHKVSIFESHSSPGGYTAGFFRKGFYFESGTLSFETSASVFKAMKDIGVFDKISFVKENIRWLSKRNIGTQSIFR
jgi:phytoene dehydrogenase-like protein